MNRFLEKIAKEYYNETRVEHDSIGNKIGLGVVGAVSAGIVNKKIGNSIQGKIGNSLLNSNPTIALDILEKIKREVLPATNSTMDISEVGGTRAYQNLHRNILGAAGPHYAPKESLTTASKYFDRLARAGESANKHLGKYTGFKIPNPFEGEKIYDASKPFVKNYVHLGSTKNTDALAHELGHAVDLNKGMAKLKRVSGAASKFLTGKTGVIVGGAMLGNEKTRDYAWMVPLVGAAPMLRSEAMANYHMSKLVGKHGGNPKNLKGLIAKNTASYLLSPLLTSGTLAGINYLRHKGEEVNADEWLRDRD